MIRNVFRKLIPLMLAIAVLISMPVSVRASENFDLNAACSIRITLKDIYHPDIDIGGQAEIFHVGEAYVSNSALCYRLTSAFAASGVSLNDLNAPGLASALEAYAIENGITGATATADENGAIVFDDLAVGAYLVIQKDAVDGYLKVSPFVVGLPMYSNNGVWDYHVDASPKVQRPPKDTSLSVIKKWLDNSAKDRPDSIWIDLLRDGEVFESVELNSDNGWKYEWASLNAYYNWTALEAEVPEGYEVSYKSSGTTVIITNTADGYTPPAELIQTGQLNWPVPVMFSCGLCLLAAGLFLMKKREQNQDAA